VRRTIRKSQARTCASISRAHVCPTLSRRSMNTLWPAPERPVTSSCASVWSGSTFLL
jgi:hypothetical protein